MAVNTVIHDGVAYTTCVSCGAVLDDGLAVRCEQRDGFWYHYRLGDGERVPRHVVAFVDVR